MAESGASDLLDSVAQTLTKVLNIPVNNTALAKRVVAAAQKGTIESFSVVCASFGLKDREKVIQIRNDVLKAAEAEQKEQEVGG